MRVAKGTECEGGSMAGGQRRGGVTTYRAEVAHLIRRHIEGILKMVPAERHRAASEWVGALSPARGLDRHRFESIFVHCHMFNLCTKIVGALVRHRRRARESAPTNMVCAGKLNLV